MRRAQLLAGVQPPALAPQPLAVEQMAPGELGAHSRSTEPLDRITVELVGGLAFAQERPRAQLDPKHPVGPTVVSPRRELV